MQHVIPMHPPSSSFTILFSSLCGGGWRPWLPWHDLPLQLMWMTPPSHQHHLHLHLQQPLLAVSLEEHQVSAPREQKEVYVANSSTPRWGREMPGAVGCSNTCSNKHVRTNPCPMWSRSADVIQMLGDISTRNDNCLYMLRLDTSRQLITQQYKTTGSEITKNRVSTFLMQNSVLRPSAYGAARASKTEIWEYMFFFL